jgi:hypothetical protein
MPYLRPLARCALPTHWPATCPCAPCTYPGPRALAVCSGHVSRPQHRPPKNDSRGIAATKPFFRDDETILKRRAFNSRVVTARILA